MQAYFVKQLGHISGKFTVRLQTHCKAHSNSKEFTDSQSKTQLSNGFLSGFFKMALRAQLCQRLLMPNLLRKKDFLLAAKGGRAVEFFSLI